jgi:DNA modification methylase
MIVRLRLQYFSIFEIRILPSTIFLFMTNAGQINCPNCGTPIDVQDILAHQVEEQIKLKYQSALAEEKKKYDLQQAALVREKEDFDNKKKRENELFQERLDQKVKEERKLLEEKLKQKMLDEQKEQFEMLQKELKEKSAQIQELNKSKAEIEKLKREKDEMKSMIEAEAAKRLNAQIIEEKEKIRKAEEEKNEVFDIFYENIYQMFGSNTNNNNNNNKKMGIMASVYPTTKPIKLYDWVFHNYAKPNDLILDTHLGSGSSRIAAHRDGLSFVGCEIDKEYFESQEKRFKQFTAQLTLF